MSIQAPRNKNKHLSEDVAMERPQQMWLEIDTPSLVACLVGLGILYVAILTAKDGFVLILDHANLAFHEAGHVFFGLLGQTAGLYGGTLGQLVFPSTTAIVFWRRRETYGFTFAVFWFFENFLNIARYMADARAQRLPLVGGGDHDWTAIFGRWGLLHADTRIATLTKTIGWIGMISITLWLLWRWKLYTTQTRN